MARWKWMAAAITLVATQALASAEVQTQDSSSSSSSSSQRKKSHDDTAKNAPVASVAAASSSISSDQPHERDPIDIVLESWEVRSNEQDGDVAWTRVTAHDDESSKSDNEQSHVERMEPSAASEDNAQLLHVEEHLRITLESLLAQVQEQANDLSHLPLQIDPAVVEQLEQLVHDAVSSASSQESGGDFLLESLLDGKSKNSDKLLGLSELAEQILDQLDDAADTAEAAPGGGYDGSSDDYAAVEAALELSQEFLDLEKRLDSEGFTEEIIAKMQQLATDQNDVYAKETLAYMELFEPAVATRKAGTSIGNFTQAFVNLRAAADAGVVSAMSTLAMLNLIDFGVPRNASVSIEQRHEAAESLLRKLAASGDLSASLAVGYRYLSDKMKAPSVPKARGACDNAVMHYHRCAESNIHALADQGGEKPFQIAERLSEEWLPSSSFVNEDSLVDPAQRFEYYRTLAADPADPQWAEATEHIGQAYFYGDDAAGVEQNQQVAAQYFQRAADAGDAHAQANFGMMLANGVGIVQNNASALTYFRSAAEQGNAFAHYGLGVMYLMGSTPVVKNETKAMLYFERAAELGYNEAHTYLGSAYMHGRGVARNGSKAFEHFSLAAETKSSQALFNLAVVQYRGVGTPKSCEQAVHNFRVVALHPDVLSQLPFSLTKGYECYQKGDYLRAFLHYRLVAELGDEDAQINAAYLLEKYGDVIFPRATSDDESDSIESDGAAVIPWMGTTKRPLAEAYGLYTQAANLNDTEGIRKTAMCFYDEWEGVCERNHSIALERYSLAAQLGDSEAAFNCGLIYALGGDGISRNLETAKASERTMCLITYYAQCSQDEFPANVPCAIALTVLDTVLALRSLGQYLLVFGQS